MRLPWNSGMKNDSSLDLYHIVLSHTPCGMALVDADGAVLLANPPLRELLGVDDEAARRSLANALAKAADGALKGLAPEQTAEWEHTLDCRGGAHRECRISVGPQLADHLRLITVTDLTPRRERDRRLYSLWEFSSVISASLDLSVLLESVSTEICEVLGAERVEVVLVDADSGRMQVRADYRVGEKKPSITFREPDDHEVLPVHIRQVLDQTETVFLNFEDDGACGEKCSATIPMIARGTVIGAFTAEGCQHSRQFVSEHISLCHAVANQAAVAVDNVRLLNAEIAARRDLDLLQVYYRDILDNTPDGVFQTDLDGLIRFWNRPMEEMYGVSSDEAVGRSLFEDFPCWQAHSASFQRVVQRCEPVRLERQPRTNHRDEAVVESIHLQPLHRAGEFIGVLVRVTDVTEQASLERQLIRSERMAAVGELAAGVAHNFNNILASIGGDAQLLRMIAEEDGLNDSVLNSADMIYRETMRGGRIAHDLLSFARGQEPVISEVDVGSLVAETMRLVRTFPGTSSVDMRTQVPAGLPKVAGDPNQLHQVFLNIILNALQAMSHGGTLTVDARIVDGADGKARVEVIFEDTGVGIPEDQLTRIFEPFYSNRRGGSVGTGLGLSVSLSMVRGMDGDIRATSRTGRGTTMTVALPIVERRRRPRLDERPRPRILVADDEPNIRRTLATFLSRSGYHVVTARDGEEALTILKDPGNAFHLVIVDLLMPRMSGLETIHALRSLHPDLPVLVCSGVANAEELAQVEALGITRHLGKPVDFDDLLRAVEDLAGSAETPVLRH